MLIKDLEDAENEMSAEELDTIIPYPKKKFLKMMNGGKKSLIITKL